MNKLNELVKSVDLYGAPVSLNFRGAENYNTLGGGFISMLTLAFMTFLIAELFIKMMNFQEPTIQKF